MKQNRVEEVHLRQGAVGRGLPHLQAHV